MQAQGWELEIEDIARERRQGALGLARRCAVAVKAAVGESVADSDEVVRARLYRIAETILRGQPSMAPLVNLLNQALAAAAVAKSAAAVVASVTDICDRFRQSLDGATDSIFPHIRSLIPQGGNIVTLSFSLTIADCLSQLGAQVGGVKVSCLESRPLCEGRELAAYLTARGLDVTLVVDGAAYEVMREADLCLVGVDAMGAHGVTNKLGTAMLGSVADSLGLPMYAVGDQSKLWPASLDPPRIVDRPAAEVWVDAPQGLRVVNKYFEITPWELFKGVVTDRGILTTKQVVNLSMAIQPDRDFLEVLRRAHDE